MSKYVIHACSKRMWYVIHYLVPSMQQQGIEDIIIKCDERRVGNLEGCMQIFESMPNDDKGAWHLQDDVIICRDFKRRTEELESQMSCVICGYVWENDSNLKFEGYTSPQDMWWSFPCIFIPNKLARECAKWVRSNEVVSNEKYAETFEKNKFDDYMFKEFLIAKYPNDKVFHLHPSLVDHIDHLIGGSTVNKDRQRQMLYAPVRAYNFEDTDLILKLTEKLNNDTHNKNWRNDVVNYQLEY